MLLLRILFNVVERLRKRLVVEYESEKPLDFSITFNSLSVSISFAIIVSLSEFSRCDIDDGVVDATAATAVESACKCSFNDNLLVLLKLLLLLLADCCCWWYWDSFCSCGDVKCVCWLVVVAVDWTVGVVKIEGGGCCGNGGAIGVV